MSRLSFLATLTLGFALAGGALAQSQTPSSTSQPAQSPPARGQRALDPQHQLERMTKQLQLTADQQAKIGPILQTRDQQVQAVRNDASLKPADRRAKVMSIVQDSGKQIDALLTDPQREKLKAMREKAMERMEDRRNQHVPSSSSSGG